MAYICKDCYAELRVDLNATGRISMLPQGWTGVISAKERDYNGNAIGWRHWTSHDECADLAHEGQVMWVDLPKYPFGSSDHSDEDQDFLNWVDRTDRARMRDRDLKGKGSN